MNKPEKQLGRAKRDVERHINEGECRRFPSFDSLAEWAVGQGYATSVEAVRNHHQELWPELLFEWYAAGQVACIFATYLARQWEDAKWHSVVLDDAWSADLVTAIIDAHVDHGAEGLQLLFPGQGTAEEAFDIVRKLSTHPRWRCEDTGWLGNEQGDSIHIGLRWNAEDGSYESWAVGIAPYETMPFTRQFSGAPFIALVVRPLPPADARADTPQGTTGLPASHLAHMDDRLGDNDHKRGRWAEQTKLAKRALIHPEPLSRARAKVTFSFGVHFAERLQEILPPQG
ncbi:hypothetical protein [Duganella sp. HH105]|uniref:hypothetical protein n=1 Tax=Duganella sp. HH105 TaxID=1781067 RepID=UPI000877DE7C|nr:hypothetical protein [Duganella sp. HH105]OEZ61259.1 hypothetical protein DUGA6_22850 [Duganella sp. HH105]